MTDGEVFWKITKAFGIMPAGERKMARLKSAGTW